MKRKLVKVMAVVSATFAVTASAAVKEEEDFDTPPGWLRRPSAEDLLAIFPVKALQKGLAGKATIECTVSIEGVLHGCKAVSESPPGMGFGQAAIALTPQLLMKPALKDGKPVPAVVRMPINFEPAGTPVTLGETVLTQVAWTAAPSMAEVRDAYPAKAKTERTGGRVALDCAFAAEGRLSRCKIVAEEPRGAGFSKAALNLSKLFVGPTVVPSGKSTRGMTVHFPITFSVAALEGDSRIGKPLWVKLPTAQELVDATPVTTTEGTYRIVFDCGIASTGRLEQCRVDSESPQGIGLGQEVLKLTPEMQVALWTAEGLPTIGGRVKVPLRYEFKNDSPQ